MSNASLLRNVRVVDIINTIFITTSFSIIALETLLHGQNYCQLVQPCNVRLGFIAIGILTTYLYGKKPTSKVLKFLRAFYPLIFLGYFYAETVLAKNIILADIDPLLDRWDSQIFGGSKPAYIFSKVFHQNWFKELMNFGYSSYFLVIITALVFSFYNHAEYFEETLCVILCSFYLYYVLYYFIPAVGPQYFWPSPTNYVDKSGVFPSLVELLQTQEKPTGAFPSSHVGIATILLIITFKRKRVLFCIFLPIVLILMSSTVYIKAHYFLDVVAGILSGFIIYRLSLSLYQHLSKTVALWKNL